MILTIVSAVVALVVIVFLSLFLLLSIDKLTKTTTDRIRHNASLIINDYDEIIEKKRKEIEELEKKKNGNVQIIYRNNSDGPVLNAKAPVLDKEKTLSSADVYKILRSEFDFDAVETARKILNNLPATDSKVKIMQGILNKIDKETFAELDTLDKKQQFSLLSEVLDSSEMELVKESGKFGIELYNYFEKATELKKDNVEFYVANEKYRNELKEKLGIDSIVSDEIVEGMNVFVNGDVHKYSIERSELQ